MQEIFEEKYHELESQHFWFKARRNYILQLVEKENRDIHILDIGCSSGILLQELADRGFERKHLYGVDISEKAIARCRQNGLVNTFVMDAHAIELPVKFDVIIASDCLEHLKDDTRALLNWKTLLKEEGRLHVFVPAYKFLWSQHDKANYHYRRYTAKNLNNKLARAGLTIKFSSYWNFFLFIPIVFARIISETVLRGKTRTGDLNNIPKFNTLLYRILSTENKLLKRITFPFGVSVYTNATVFDENPHQ